MECRVSNSPRSERNAIIKGLLKYARDILKIHRDYYGSCKEEYKSENFPPPYCPHFQLVIEGLRERY